MVDIMRLEPALAGYLELMCSIQCSQFCKLGNKSTELRHLHGVS
jgi:hypothetical protein